MYLTGRGLQQDYSAAALWFRKAAAQGYARAQSLKKAPFEQKQFDLNEVVQETINFFLLLPLAGSSNWLV